MQTLTLLKSQDLLWATCSLAGAILIAMMLHSLAFSLLARMAHSQMHRIVIQTLRAPARWIITFAALVLAVPIMPLPWTVLGPLKHTVVLALIACCAWLALELTNLLEASIAQRYRRKMEESLAARSVRTQILVIQRIVILLIAVLGVAAMLLTFPSIWHIGAGLFASAGLAGIAIGAAARPTLSNLLAGVQIAFSDLIHVDDVVIVEGEWGRIDEIRTTCVLLRLGDERRMIVPLGYFMDHSFQDWTRTASDLLGMVFLYVDYSVPLDDLRDELQRVLKASTLWNGRVCNLQVTNTSERVMELRVTVSASDAGKCWDLRCLLREKLIAFLNRYHPDCLPKVRSEAPVSALV
jgi:small-conductance mechanosensitive channel